MPFGATHFPIRSVANTALSSFFKEIVVLGSENVPEEGPLIVACSHSNMAIDVSICLAHGCEEMLIFAVPFSLRS
jgi:glycerol-3-phosphate O-acyltransferase/dihydroxyacetone phosphate acyltransferase